MYWSYSIYAQIETSKSFCRNFLQENGLEEYLPRYNVYASRFRNLSILKNNFDYDIVLKMMGCVKEKVSLFKTLILKILMKLVTI